MCLVGASGVEIFFHNIKLIGGTKRYRKFILFNKEQYGEWYKHSKFVCTKENGEPVTTNTYKYLSRIVNHELQINFSMHSLRNTHATLLLENGANLKYIQKRLGHSKLSTIMDTYSHVTKRMKNETVNIFENIAKNLPPS